MHATCFTCTHIRSCRIPSSLVSASPAPSSVGPPLWHLHARWNRSRGMLICFFLVVRRVVLDYNWRLEANLRARGPSRPKSAETNAKMNTRGCFLEHFGLRLSPPEGSEPLRGRCGCHPGVRGSVFFVFFWKTVICVIRCPSEAEVPLLQVEAPKLELLGPKNQNRAVQSCKSEGPGQEILFGRFGLAGELWKRPEIAQPPPHFKSSRRSKSI